MNQLHGTGGGGGGSVGVRKNFFVSYFRFGLFFFLVLLTKLKHERKFLSE
jgi:hypothetical protein